MAGSIPPEFIDELLDRIDIVDLIGSRLTLKRSGHNHVGLCPFHKEKTPSFSVNQDKQFYHCFGCQASGDAIRFLVDHDRMDFIQAVETLAAMAGMEVPRTESAGSEERQHRQKSLSEVLLKACDYYKTQLREHEHRSRAVDYLKQRGVTGQVARDFALGFAPAGWDNLTLKLAITNADRQLLIDSGMIVENKDEGRTYDRFRDRIMFPIRDIRGRVIAFGGRVLDDSKPKYLNSPETAIFHKGQELYGLYEARRSPQKLERVLVVEGYLDVIALAQHGVHYAVATLGTAPSKDHLHRLFRLVPEIVFCFDGDEAGEKAAWRGLNEALPLMKDGFSTRFLFLPQGEDPDTLIRKEGRDRFEERLTDALHLPDLLFQTLKGQVEMTSMEGKARLSKLAMPLINQIPEGVLKQLILDELARMTGLDRERLVKATAQKAPAGAARQPPPGGPPRGMAVAKPAHLPTIDLGIALLLRQPELSHAFDAESYVQLATLKDPDCSPLLSLVRAIQDDGALTPARLLEQFRGTPHFERLRQLADTEHLLSVDHLTAEYEGVIRKLLANLETEHFQNLKSELNDKPFDQISTEEREGIRQAIQTSRKKPAD